MKKKKNLSVLTMIVTAVFSVSRGDFLLIFLHTRARTQH